MSEKSCEKVAKLAKTRKINNILKLVSINHK